MQLFPNLTRYAAISLLAVLPALPALAQLGPGPHMAPKEYKFDEESTPGWSMMTPEEREAHQKKMMSLKSYKECNVYMEEHRRLMQARVRQQGKPSLAMTSNVCDKMRNQGQLGK